MKCPLCGKENKDDCPVYVNENTVEFGGCQACFEAQAAIDWQKMNMAISQILLREKT